MAKQVNAKPAETPSRRAKSKVLFVRVPAYILAWMDKKARERSLEMTARITRSDFVRFVIDGVMAADLKKSEEKKSEAERKNAAA
jgi:hypothetical protein